MDNETRNAEYLTLGKAAQESPGRQSANCIWRWARKGVLARTGERVRLQHVRVGGKIYTTREWLAEFGRRLAEADTSYFDAREAAARALPPRDPAYRAPKRQRRPKTPTAADEAARRARLDAINAELDAEGL